MREPIAPPLRSQQSWSAKLGTIIDLTIERITLDASKNSMGADHGPLFQEGDLTRRRAEGVNYDWYDEHPDEDVASSEAAFVRPLSRVLPRLDLLGHTLNTARAEYDELVRQLAEMEDEGDPSP